jgi:hypothetical protein
VLGAKKEVFAILMKGSVPVGYVTGDGVFAERSAIDDLPAFEITSLETWVFCTWVTFEMAIFKVRERSSSDQGGGYWEKG